MVLIYDETLEEMPVMHSAIMTGILAKHNNFHKIYWLI
jgi:hypothetical protein